jgi:integrase
VWGERLVAAIGRRDVIELIDGIADRGALTMARRLHAHLHRLFRWAVGRGILETNPMADLPKPGAAVKRDRVLTDAELAAVLKAAEKIDWPFGPAFRLLALTACRGEEIGALRWSEIHGNEIRIPGSRSKNAEARIVPLSSAAAELIATLPRIGDHVFTTNGTAAISGWSKAKRALDTAAAEIAGAPLKPWRLHDLRRVIATNLQRLGVGLQVVESILGHVGGSRAGIVGVYQLHRFDTEQRAGLEAWSHEIERIVAGKKAVPSHASDPLVPAAAALTLSGSPSVVEVLDTEWVAAIRRAERDKSPEPLVAYLKPAGGAARARRILVAQNATRADAVRSQEGRQFRAAGAKVSRGGPPTRRRTRSRPDASRWAVPDGSDRPRRPDRSRVFRPRRKRAASQFH